MNQFRGAVVVTYGERIDASLVELLVDDVVDLGRDVGVGKRSDEER